VRKRRPYHKGTWCSGGSAPRILNQGIRWNWHRVPNDFSSVKNSAVSGLDMKECGVQTHLRAAEKRTHPSFPESESWPLRLYRNIFSLLLKVFTTCFTGPIH
jgi:hypothetical protein